jgi:hypothetical protein
MAGRGEYAVKVNGLVELRRALTSTDAEAKKAVQASLKRGVTIAAERAALLAPRGRTGRLAAGYRGYTRGNVAGVRNPVVYAGVHEYGGTITPRGVPILIQRSAPITRAIERETDAIVEDIAEGIETATSRLGW